jgi:Leucine-rich repeat (LRR) protein
MEVNFSMVNNSSNSRRLSHTANSKNENDILGELTKYPNKGVLIAHLVNFKLYQISNDTKQQNLELKGIENILNESNSSITLDEVQHLLNNESYLFQVQLPSSLKQAIIYLINNDGSEYQRFVNKLIPNAHRYLEDNDIPNLAKDILIGKLEVWVNEALEGEKSARLTARRRIQEVFENNFASLNLSSLNLTTIPANIFCYLINLTSLNLSGNLLDGLPEGVFNGLIKLENLNLSNNDLCMLPERVFNGLTNLEYLHLSNSHLVVLPERIFNDLTKLKILDLSNNQLWSIPERLFKDLTKLENLNLSNNQLSTLSDELLSVLFNIRRRINLMENRFSVTEVKRIQDSFISSNARVNISVYEGEQSLDTTSYSTIDGLKIIVDSPPIHGTVLNTKVILNSDRVSRFGFILEEPYFQSHQLSTSSGELFHGPLNTFHSLATTHNLTTNLHDILTVAEVNYQLGLNWEELEQSNVFNQFLNHVSRMADARPGTQGRNRMYQSLASIIMAMDQNAELLKVCFNIARESTQTCGDRVALSFIQMQLQTRLYQANPSLSQLFSQQKAMCALELIYKLARDKVEGLTGIIDEVEVYLTYIKHLKDYLEVDIENILYEALSNVTRADIEAARAKLTDTLTDDYIYKALLDSNVVKERYASEFKAIQDQPEFDTLPLDVESDSAYSTRMKNLDSRFTEAKVNFLKEQLRNFERVFETLPPLVNG